MRRLLLLLLCACGPHDVVSVAFDGGRPPPLGDPCNDSTDCRDFELCEKHDCETATGRCAPKMCMPGGGPVCGCDGQTYASNCARKMAGVYGFVPGACQ